MIRLLLTLATATSLLLFVAACAEEALRFPDVDFSFCWASKGRMISVDSFEDVPQANAITVRRFSPMPSDVPFHFRHCAVEVGDDAPCAGVGMSVEVWLDKSNQPVGRLEGGRLARPMTVTVLAQIPLSHVGTFCAVTAFLPALWCANQYRWRRTRRQRRDGGLCVACGYDLRSSKDRCPECGMPIPKEAEVNA